MAKITITLEDSRNDDGSPVVTLDMTGVPVSLGGNMHQTAAVRMSQTLYGMAASDEALGTIAAYRWQPANNTRH